MTPTQADTVIAGIRARLTRLAWSPEVWDDFREAMLRVKINDRQGMAAVSNVVMTVKGVPAPAHFIEAFKSAQGEKPQTCSPATPESGYRGEFWHPRGWAIVRGWMWMRREENWDKLPALMEEFSRASGWLPNWEAIIAPNPPGPFTNEEIQELGLWVNGRTKKSNPRGSFDQWAEKQREDQARRVRLITELRKQIARKAIGKE